ncbi:MAG: hypothetical protein ABSH20_10415 [Tepidisphaeraceae bacterium]|jgi:DNA repair exonuclease SbcCD ATPase subunit
MKCALPAIVAVLAAAVLTGGGCDRPANKGGGPQTSGQPAVKRTEWTAADISKDPQGYLQWSDQQVVAQIAANDKKLRAIQNSREQFSSKRNTLLENISDVANINKRLSEAVQRAEDEDRWPVRMGDRTFSREKAQTILQQTKQYIEERQPMASKYDQFLQKLDDTAASVRAENVRLAELREKIALDIEGVKLNQGMAEVDKLRSAESQLRQMSSAVASLSAENDPLQAVPPKEPPGRVNIDDMLK